jgi:YD repeat-containing protein
MTCKNIAFGLLALGAVASLARADIIPPKNYAVTPGGLNFADGSLAYSVTDLAIGTMKLERFYRTSRQQPNDPPFGTNFSNNFDIYVAISRRTISDPKRPIVHIGNKASGVYVISSPTGNIAANNTDAYRGNLTKVGNKYVYVDGSDGSGTVYTFSDTVQATGMTWASDSRKIETIAFPDGRRQNFYYNSGGYLRLVEDSAGYAMLFDVNGSGDVTAACAFNRSRTFVDTTSTCTGSTLKATYGYTITLSKPYLTSVTNSLGQVTTYTNANFGMTCVKPPGFSSCTMTLSDHTTRIGSQTLLDGGTWTTSGMSPDVLNNPDANYDYECANEASFTDPNNKTTYGTFTGTSPCTLTDPLGHSTRFFFEGAHQFQDTGPIYRDGTFLTKAVYPEGNIYLAEYLGPFRSVSKETLIEKPHDSLPESSLASLIKEYHYGSCSGPTGSYQNCAKPTWILDPKGNRTDLAYGLHGGMTSEMKPAPTSGASRPLKLWTYVQRNAYLKFPGEVMIAADPIWMLSSETQCQTAAGAANSNPLCDTSAGAPIVTTNYQYGADGSPYSLVLLGATVVADGQSRRTCYSYDDYSRRISETKPKANLSVCP